MYTLRVYTVTVYATVYINGHVCVCVPLRHRLTTDRISTGPRALALRAQVQPPATDPRVEDESCERGGDASRTRAAKRRGEEAKRPRRGEGLSAEHRAMYIDRASSMYIALSVTLDR